MDHVCRGPQEEATAGGQGEVGELTPGRHPSPSQCPLVQRLAPPQSSLVSAR